MRKKRVRTGPVGKKGARTQAARKGAVRAELARTEAVELARTEAVEPARTDAVEPARADAAEPEITEVWDLGDRRDGDRRDGGGAEGCPPRNLLILGDNLHVLDALWTDLAGKIDLVYIDPPFATGGELQLASRIGEGDAASRKIRAQPSVRETAYLDSWGRDLGAYLAMLTPRLRRIRSLLAADGSLFIHLDRRAAHHVKLLLDEIFGADRCVNEIVWCYTGPSSPGMRSFANKHDVIFWYARGDRWTFNADLVRLPYKESTRRNEGRRTGFTTGDPSLVVRLHPLGKFPEDWWVLPVEAPASRVRTGYPTQKPERLLERVLLAATREGALVADFFCGSGTTLAVAERLGRRWIGCDSSRLAVETTRRRLLDLPTAEPFEVRVLRTGLRIRAGLRTKIGPRILEAYGASPEAPEGPVHGRKGTAPVVLLADDDDDRDDGDGDGDGDVADALERALACVAGGAASDPGLRAGAESRPGSRAGSRAGAGPVVHALRSRWPWRLLEAARAAAHRHDLRLLPVEVGERGGPGTRGAAGSRSPSLDILFREVPEVRAEVRVDADGRAVVILTDLARLAPGLLPPEILAHASGSHARGWSDLVDAWAVDWDWRGGPFRPGFAAYRTRKRRALSLRSPPRALEEGGPEGDAPGDILVQVRDVLGVEAYVRLARSAIPGPVPASDRARGAEPRRLRP